MSPRMLASALFAAVAAGCATAPAGAPAAGGAAATFPTTPPQLGPAPSLTLPSPARRSLANGLEVVYVRHGGLPVVHATLVTRGGTTEEPAALPGLAAFVSQMIDEGAGGRSSLQLASDLDLLGATLTTGAGWDAAFLDLHVLSHRLPQALAIMADVAIRPDFPQDELVRIREERVVELTRGRDEPRVIAGNAFTSLLYGAEHPYGRLPNLEATERIDRQALQGFHERFYRPGGATLILVGDVDAAALHPVVERAFGGWTGTAPAPVALPPAPRTPATTLYAIDRPGAAQSEIRVGHPGVERSSPDFFPLVVLNTVLGGSFTSRLNMNLRETHGFAYDASSAFSMRRGAGPFSAASAVFTAKTDSAVVEFFNELNRIRSDRVERDELERAKNFVALGLPRRFETTAGVASQLADLEVYGLGIDFYNSYVQRVMAVTAEDVQRVANSYLHPDRAVVVVVGDLAAIEPGLRAIRLGPVEIRRTNEFVR